MFNKVRLAAFQNTALYKATSAEVCALRGELRTLKESFHALDCTVYSAQQKLNDLIQDSMESGVKVDKRLKAIAKEMVRSFRY